MICPVDHHDDHNKHLHKIVEGTELTECNKSSLEMRYVVTPMEISKQDDCMIYAMHLQDDSNLVS